MKRKKLQKITPMTNRHYGKNDMKELHVCNYEIGLNNWILRKKLYKGFFERNYMEDLENLKCDG